VSTRRVVTGPTSSADSDVVIDDRAPWHIPSTDGGPATTLVWTTPQTPTVPTDGHDPTQGFDVAQIFPNRNGTRFLIVEHPPGSGVTGGFGGARETTEALGLDESGMHATDTVDYAVVLTGQVCVVLDGGKEIVLSAGDTLVQNGTRHSWQNRSDGPARVAIVMVGADRG